MHTKYVFRFRFFFFFFQISSQCVVRTRWKHLWTLINSSAWNLFCIAITLKKSPLKQFWRCLSEEGFTRTNQTSCDQLNTLYRCKFRTFDKCCVSMCMFHFPLTFLILLWYYKRQSVEGILYPAAVLMLKWRNSRRVCSIFLFLSQSILLYSAESVLGLTLQI